MTTPTRPAASSGLTDLLVELHVPDFGRAEAFYGSLGFSPVRREPRYLVMRRHATVINFFGGDEAVAQHSYFGAFPDSTKRGYGVELVIFVENLDAAHETVAAIARVVTPPQSRPWGCRDFRIEDPFGYYLRISEPYPAIPPIEDGYENGATTHA